MALRDHLVDQAPFQGVGGGQRLAARSRLFRPLTLKGRLPAAGQHAVGRQDWLHH
jgi:hypothetical protein